VTDTLTRSSRALPANDPARDPIAADAPPLHPLVSAGIIGLTALAILYLAPKPAAVSIQGWRMLAIFICTVLALMLRPLPVGAAVLIGVLIEIVGNVLTPAQALAGYANTTVWLVVFAYLFSRAVINSGLARRLALVFVRRIGHTSLGLGYALVACDVVMASIIPGNSGRIGGILTPIARSLAEIYESRPGPTASLLGSYLMLTLYQGDMVACAMFLTGQAGNPIAASLAMEMFHVPMTWSGWLLVSIVPAAASFVVVPWFVYKTSPPAIRHTPEAAAMARQELTALGPVTRVELTVIGVFLLVCGLWATSSLHSMQTVTVALFGVVLLLVLKSLAWGDIVREHMAWDVFLWFGGIIRMGEALNEFGVTKAFATGAASILGGWSWPILMVAIVLLFFYVHYFFASVTIHILSLFIPFCSLLITAGAPAALVVFSLAFCANLAACLTHFGTTPGPIVYSTGYVATGTWWRVGLLISFVHIGLWGTLGLAWWKVLGLW
jgi:DASS family divalent anion:Na+ symporter